MRTFIATWLGPDLRERISDFVRDIRSRSEIQTPVKWVRPESMHLTIQFLGDIDPSTVMRIEAALGQIEFTAFRIHVHGVGFFPRETAARVFWAGVTSEGFSELADRVHGHTAALGFQPPAHPMKPHLTLARARGGFRFDQALIDIARGFRDYEFGSATLDRMVLVESRLFPDGARYSEVAAFRSQDQA